MSSVVRMASVVAASVCHHLYAYACAVSQARLLRLVSLGHPAVLFL